MTPPLTAEPRYRPDLEGLRGVAILLVLLCHVRIPGAEAGFVGVDVFFVLSGFLITGLLVNERERTGRIALGPFYARRARRIFPAAALVLAATLMTAQLVLSPLDLRRIADDGLAASLSLANMRYAVDATDYFALVDTSPMLHFWSLAVEEQFYLLWPILLLTVSRIGRPRVAMAALATAVLGGSFVLCSALTDPSSAWAYFSLPTRAWQLAAGGLLALSAPLLGRVPHAVAAAVGWLGAALLGASLVAIGPTTAYPGLASLLPTLGAVALIASGGILGSPGWLALATAPVRWLGRISYSLYLWHWPIRRIPGRVAIIVDTPRSDHDVPACMAQHRKAIERCTTPRSAAFGWRHKRREAEAARLTGATLVDLSTATCPTDPCPPVVGSMLVYRDHHHLTATFVRSLADELEAALPVGFGSLLTR
jgi:peptidoglycan/LPS O-acetylase OafA/YrhL